MRPSGGVQVLLLTFSARRAASSASGTEFLTDTRGTGIMNHLFDGWEPWQGDIEHRATGTLVADRQGRATAYRLREPAAARHALLSPGDEVYEGMVIGEHARGNDLDVNVTKEKKLSNMRASGSDDMIRLIPPRLMNLEQAIAYLADDELVEVTPQSIRLRKRLLDPNDRKRASRAAAAAE